MGLRRLPLLGMLIVASSLLPAENSDSGLVPQNQYRGEPCLGEGDPFCVCSGVIGGENCSGSGHGRTWGVQCEDDSCYAWIDCGDEEGVIDCEGDYTAQADYTGVRCRDTGSDLGERESCP